MRALIVSFALCASAAVAQEPPRVRWSLSTGPTIAQSRNAFWMDGGACGGATCDPGDDVIGGGLNGRYHAALGVSRAIRRTALILRGDFLYNRIESSANSRSVWFASSLGPVFMRNAMRDESYVASVGFELDAFPSQTASPYLLTGTGFMINRLGWSRDTTSARPDQQHDSFGVLFTGGAGFRVRAGKREVFTEWRKYATAGGYGSGFAPLSLGVRF